MFNFINFRSLTTTALLGILMAGSFVIPSASSQDNSSDSVTLTGTLRDFSDQHPDFERDPGDTSSDGTAFRYGSDQGITTNSLGLDQKPIYAGGSFSTTNQGNFDQWYRNIANVNQSKEFAIELTKQSNGVYRYENTNFFPLNGQLMGNEGRSNNYHFTYELHTRFTYQGGEVFNFSGDDDVWVYINGKKVIDIGGVHSRQDASVNLDNVASNIGLEVGESYNLDFFFAERHTTQSNFIIETTLELETVNEDDPNALIPTLWGIDEDDGQLFAMEDYTDSTTMIDYGLLKWNDNGTIKTIGQDMEAMTIDENGDMYIALDRKLSGGGNGATLLKFNVAHASTTSDNIAEVLGDIGINFNSSKDNVSGLSIDPTTGELVALLKNYDSSNDSVKDKLYVLSKTDGSQIEEIGTIEGLGEQSRSGEDIEHAPDGSLYVTDNGDDETYRVNSNTGAIIEVVDYDQEDGLGSSSVKFEALGWDFANNRLIGFDDNDESLAKLTLEDGNNYEYYDTTSIGLTDVEGVDFVPTIDGEPIDPPKKPTEEPEEEDNDSDADNNGILDADELPGDVDGDGVVNYLDLDDDGDNIADVMELHTPNAIKNTGKKEMTIPGTQLTVLLPNPPEENILDSDAINSDGDNTPDYQDLDSDNDTISDKDEAGDENLKTTPAQSDSDNTPDYLDEDSDNDTISDKDEAGDSNPNTAPVNTDNDSLPNFIDLDSDSDNISDADEAGDENLATAPDDSDNDSVADYIDEDSDNDYISDKDEAGDENLATAPVNTDKGFGADGDNIPDYLDDDSDGDSILDSKEAGDQDLSTSPYNSDNINDQGLIDRKDLGFPSYDDQIPDFLDLDSDDNGILDADELDGSVDNDQIDNYRDLDDDGDGIADVIEIGADPANPTNSDNDVNDGEDYQDTNSDNDPWSDSFEGVSTGNGTTPITVTAADGTTTTVNLKNYSETNLVDAVSIESEENGKVTITGTPLGYDYQTPTFSD